MMYVSLFFRRLLRWISGLLLAGGLLFLGILHFSLRFTCSEKSILSAAQDHGTRFERIKNEGAVWVTAGNPEGIPVVLIHGSPGGWDDYLNLLVDEALRERFYLISVCRAGYGGDTMGTPVPSLNEQAAWVSKALSEDRPALVVGHSLGASVAARLAVDFPERVGGLLLLAAPLDTRLERVLPIQRLADSPLVSWMLPAKLNVCNRELIPLADELNKLEPQLDQLSLPIIALHGDADRLVPVENMKFFREKVQGDHLEIRLLPETNHFLPWRNVEEIRQALFDLENRMTVNGKQ